MTAGGHVDELGHQSGEGSAGGQAAGPNEADRLITEAAARADLLRSRHAVFGREMHPRAAMFLARAARATAAVPQRSEGERSGDAGAGDRAPGSTADPRAVQLAELGEPAAGRSASHVLPALRDAVFGSSLLPHATAGPEIVPLPAAPALVCDSAEHILRVNSALLRLSGRDTDGPAVHPADAMRGGHEPGGGLFGLTLSQLVVGPDADARLVRVDGSRVRVRVVRWELPGAGLSAVVLVELDDCSALASRVVDPGWTAELERLARVGTWTFDLATSTLHRSETLQELYRSLGVDPDGAGSAPVEGQQVALLCQSLRSGARAGDHHLDLPLPGNRMLSCRAEVECSDDGTPVRLVGVVHDVSAERLARRRVELSGQRFADLMSIVPSGVALVDPSGRVVDANPGLCRLLDTSLERLRGIQAAALSVDELLIPDTWPAEVPAADGGPVLPGWLRPVPPGAGHAYRVGAAPLRRGDGTTVWCEMAVSVTSADDGGWFWLVACTDISDRRRAAEVLRSAGTVDELTRLPNRAACLELVDRLLTGASRYRVAVVCGDLDDFARVNSSLGYEAGDDLLLTLAGRLQRELPVSCTAGRLSGDEFVVICSDHTEVGGPDLLAKVVADLLTTTITVHGRPVQLTASVGLATSLPTGEARAADLLRFAEAAMHDAKRRQSRGAIGMATDGIMSSATQALDLEAELREAIAGDSLVLEYQPVVGPDGTVLSAEALVRWPHPDRGLISPADFLPVAQRSGLLRELDLWVLRTAAREAAGWPEHRGRKPAVAINLAGLLPSEVDFLTVVSDTLIDAGLAWNRLVLELVETSLVALPPHALAAMAELVERGLRFAVDDFGTGYSSLARLKELPAQIVKVDRSFVTGIADCPADFAVARAVVDMARAMGRTTVAEGVETADQFHVLRGIGVDAYPGWLFSRPLPAVRLRDVLLQGRIPTPASATPATPAT
ncbi:EAL domain-containing protein [Pseudonocardia xinjiangensis]|uniref:EAL domain-containing protein n=1 Tax=Pseudonocardia xinjiangensis TaxID=75289 RepID=A0ABX1RE96_9PSEU|nr:GGDEF domain-containing phosphodiesterase [Pseudonocardia xinjiangensis]NMH78702.1 EAL domain-containing protein [Pseudonocardia xinjiangensis]